MANLLRMFNSELFLEGRIRKEWKDLVDISTLPLPPDPVYAFAPV